MLELMKDVSVGPMRPAAMPELVHASEEQR